MASVDYAAGKKAVEDKQWATAADLFRRATLQDPKNADAWNMLGYSNRWASKYSEAFVAYVRTHDLGKARTQLAKLESVCGNKDCDEYKALDKAIADYKPQ